MKDHRFLNIVDERTAFFPKETERMHDTIYFKKGSFHATKDGFTYNYSISSGNGYVLAGAGIVVNRKYLGMSEAEICLTCDIENPVSSKDVDKYLDHMQINEKMKDKIRKNANLI